MRKSRFRIFLAAWVLFPAGLILCSGPAVAAAAANSSAKPEPNVVKKVEWELRTLARKMAELESIDKETVFAMLANYLWKNPEIFGAAFAFVPVVKDGQEIKSAPYIHRSGDQLIQKDLSNRYDYTAPEQKWYARPVKNGKPAWSEPYFDKGGGEAWMTTYSIPVFTGGKERRLVGVITSDVLLPAPQ